MKPVLPYIEARLRCPIPEHLHAIARSTPVIAFGDFTSATVATLGLNPSRQEFLDRSGQMLAEDRRRFETLDSVGVTSLHDADERILGRVVDGCRSYFDRNPHMRWFGPLERLANVLGTSYLSRTACHLDLVQWATDPVWGGLSDSDRQTLLRRDVPFLLEQLARHRVKVLLMNGRRVMDEFALATGFRPDELDRFTWGRRQASVYAGALDELTLVGWSVNLQSSFGVTTELRESIASAISRAVGTGR